MILIPTYSGVFDNDKRTCLVLFDGKMIPYVCNKFEPFLIINNWNINNWYNYTKQIEENK